MFVKNNNLNIARLIYITTTSYTVASKPPCNPLPGGLFVLFVGTMSETVTTAEL